MKTHQQPKSHKKAIQSGKKAGIKSARSAAFASAKGCVSASAATTRVSLYGCMFEIHEGDEAPPPYFLGC